MGIFTNKFFSAAGQKERLSNVAATLNAAFNPFAKNKGVTANVSNPTLKKVLESTASHPYVSAAVVTGGITAIAKPSVTAAAVKSILPTTAKGKVVAALTAPAIIGAVATKPTESFSAAIKAPSELAKFGSDVVTFAANPSISTGKEVIKESPLISSAIAVATLGAGIKTILPTIATSQQTAAIKEQTAAIKEGTGLISVVDRSSEFAAAKPVTAATQEVKEGGSKTSRKKKKPSKMAVLPSINQKVNVIVSNKSSSIGIRQNKKYLNKSLLN